MDVELSSLDLRYEGYRLRDRPGEARLLAAIAERGIVEPLEGVEQSNRHVLYCAPPTTVRSRCWSRRPLWTN